MIFGIFANISEFEGELIRSRVRSGLAAAKARGRKIGRPHVFVDRARVASLREQGLSWKAIGTQLGVGKELSSGPLAHPPKPPRAPSLQVTVESRRPEPRFIRHNYLVLKDGENELQAQIDGDTPAFLLYAWAPAGGLPANPDSAKSG